jgi:hypothetical protein
MTGEAKGWIFIAAEALVSFGGLGWIIWYARRRSRLMSDYIFYHRTRPTGKHMMTIYPEKLTEEQRKELAAIEARLLELAETASEEMAINLKESK